MFRNFKTNYVWHKILLNNNFKNKKKVEIEVEVEQNALILNFNLLLKNN